MSNLFLVISPIEIVVAIAVLLLMFVAALFLSAKREKGWKFFVWFLIILFLPVIGPISYLIYYAANYGVTFKLTA